MTDQERAMLATFRETLRNYLNAQTTICLGVTNDADHDFWQSVRDDFESDLRAQFLAALEHKEPTNG